jgi:glycosyltransferase involved in cell wall biosynthesis
MSPYDDVEVIVVDNGSKDDTKQAVGVFIERNGGDIKYVLEETPGVNSARNRGRTVASERR